MKREGLTCSIGIGPNKLIAKIASDMMKPDGLTTVRPRGVEQFLSQLPVRRLPGIGSKTEAVLKEMGISKIGELRNLDPPRLQRSFGKWGFEMQRLAHGIDEGLVEERGEPKSISRETTFDEDTNDPEIIEKTIDDLTEEVQGDAAEYGYLFKTITLKIRLEDFSTFTRSRTVERPIKDLKTLRETSKELAAEFLSEENKIRLLGVRVSGLTKSSENQRSLLSF
jgi:DNA polymerase IV (DinB-like DNA polymerase)